MRWGNSTLVNVPHSHGQLTAVGPGGAGKYNRAAALSWTLYIVRCRDGTLYTGITNDLERRLSMHDAGTGARYTRGRGPVQLVYREACADRSAASKREAQVKKLSLRGKRALVGPARAIRRVRVKQLK